MAIESDMVTTRLRQVAVLDLEATTAYTDMMEGIVTDDMANSEEVLQFLGEKQDDLIIDVR